MTKHDWKTNRAMVKAKLAAPSKHAIKHHLAMSIDHFGQIIYGQMRKLQRQIHSEVAPKLQAMRDAEDALNGTGRIENQNFVFDLKKYMPTFATMGKLEPELASVNDSFYAMRQLAMVRAGEHTRSLAGGSHSRE